jgi:hypothetical protein
MLIFMVVWAAAVATKPAANNRPTSSLLNFIQGLLGLEKGGAGAV